VIGVITDHGHRAGQEHFVIVIIWSGYDKEGGETYKYFCPSIDSAGHTAEKASEALKNVLECTLGSDVEVFVQRLIPEEEVQLTTHTLFFKA
jgi:hypothetical protein